ncbi:hypothetical protein Afil01_19450 [Actinorhabdospora filicis]|uniref:Uncharacterized protein n=1 Tax=Actinorhabdospora filicis TaxID=1785913 RepID=A0A9W6W8M9_9ACTN|nr:hypothetical protein [Actinorhabdospora filicis]GLZ77138.1 hypothetical protein Afil01_19450 [Actinorhabdospora filicis]
MNRARVLIIAAALAVAATAIYLYKTRTVESAPSVTIPTPPGRDGLSGRIFQCDEMTAATVTAYLPDAKRADQLLCVWEGHDADGREVKVGISHDNLAIQGGRDGGRSWRDSLDVTMSSVNGCTAPPGGRRVTEVEVTAPGFAYKGGCLTEIAGRNLIIAVATDEYALSVTVSVPSDDDRPKQELADMAATVLGDAAASLAA